MNTPVRIQPASSINTVPKAPARASRSVAQACPSEPPMSYAAPTCVPIKPMVSAPITSTSAALRAKWLRRRRLRRNIRHPTTVITTGMMIPKTPNVQSTTQYATVAPALLHRFSKGISTPDKVSSLRRAVRSDAQCTKCDRTEHTAKIPNTSITKPSIHNMLSLEAGAAFFAVGVLSYLFFSFFTRCVITNQTLP